MQFSDKLQIFLTTLFALNISGSPADEETAVDLHQWMILLLEFPGLAKNYTNLSMTDPWTSGIIRNLAQKCE
jgi:hypothetical protein